jgi:putative ABC transport system permease protein
LDKIYNVIGVVKDIHYESLHKRIEPMAILLNTRSIRFILVRINPENFQNTMSYIHKTWRSFSPERPMGFSFLDTEFDFWYKTERNTGAIASIFSAIGIFISCMGLLGLAIYIIHNRTKEIGIRKVNGASIQQILILLNSKFLKWIGIAFIISIPFGWWVMNKWLENFAYRTNINWWIFLSAGLVVLLIALLTVSWHTTAAARKNPVEALRYE